MNKSIQNHLPIKYKKLLLSMLMAENFFTTGLIDMSLANASIM